MSFKGIPNLIDVSIAMNLSKNLEDASIYLTLLSRERLHYNSNSLFQLFVALASVFCEQNLFTIVFTFNYLQLIYFYRSFVCLF